MIPRRAAWAALPVGLAGWIVIFLLFRATAGQDWMVFDTAAHAWMRGDTALLLDGPRFTDVLNATHPLGQKLAFHPWVYPPYTLLLGLPFAVLPWWLNYVSFLALSFGFMVWALRLWGAERAVVLAVALCPATAFTIGAGQNSFFSAALITGSVWFMGRRPGVSGVLAGLMAFKPQLALLVPVAFVASGAWVEIGIAALTVMVLLLVSLLVPGVALWRGWLHLFLSGDPAFHHWVSAGRLWGQSVFTCLRLVGLPEGLANAGQVLAGLVGAWAVWRAFRAGDRDRALVVLLCGAVLAAPHLGDYDEVLLGIASAFVVFRLRPDAVTGWLAVAVWCSTAFAPPRVFPFAAVAPLLVGGLMGRLAWRR